MTAGSPHPTTPPPDDEAVDAPELMRTLDEARAAAEKYAEVACGPLSTNDPGITFATMALVAELRGLSLLLEDAFAAHFENTVRRG